MSTIKALIDRLYRTYLEPPDSQPAASRLSAGISAGASSLVLTGFEVPEDEELMRAGVWLECESELWQVTAYDEDTLTCTLDTDTNNKMGTSQADHDAGARVKLSPPFARLSVFEAVADNIITLYPKLYTVTTTETMQVGGGVVPVSDNLAAELIEAWSPSYGNVDGRIVDFHPMVGGRAVELSVGVGDVWLKLRRRFGEPTDETATFDSLGLEPRWANIVMIGACADLMAGRDIPPSHLEWVESRLDAQNVPVASRGQLSARLASYRQYLLKEAEKEMRAEYRANVHMRPATQVRVRSPFG